MSSGNKVTISREELFSPNASFILGNRMAEIYTLVDVDKFYNVPLDFKSRNKNEKRSTPKTFRFSKTVESLLDEAVDKLGLLHRTEFVEAAILSACLRLGLDANK